MGVARPHRGERRDLDRIADSSERAGRTSPAWRRAAMIGGVHSLTSSNPHISLD
jgi:hypothetical protein